MTTDQKGAIAETAVAHAAVKLGIDVYRPVAEGGRYDLILDLGTRLLRVQCKWAARHGAVIFVRCYSCRRTANGMLYRPYTAREIDAIAAYCPETNRCYLLAAGLIAGRNAISLRLDPTRNAQKRRVHWADEFDFGRLDWQGISGP